MIYRSIRKIRENIFLHTGVHISKETIFKKVEKITKMKKNNKFFELLCLNDSLKLKNFLISKGKGPKPVCPVSFDVNDIKEDIDNKKEE